MAEVSRLRRVVRALRDAWWVFLLIAGYAFFSGRFLGTSCLWKSTVGLPCPGCGLTHAAQSLMTGDIAASLRWHPLLVPLILAAPFVFLRKKSRWLPQLCLIAFGAVYAVRMVFFFPHTPPMEFNQQALLPRLFHALPF